MNKHRNKLWWNSYDCNFLVSMKEKKSFRLEIIKKRKKAGMNVHRNQFW